MQRILPNRVESALLYSDFSTYSPKVWEKLINEFSAGFGKSFEITNLGMSPSYYNFQGDGITLEIIGADHAIDPEMFSNALHSEITKMDFPQSVDAVHSHSGYIHFKVTSGILDASEAGSDEDVDFPPFDETRFDFATSLLRITMAFQIVQSVPLAVYWAQCDRLFGIKDFLKLAIDTKDNSLLVHPVLFNDPENSELLGVQTYGAEAVIGREVVFAPSILPVDETRALLEHFFSITCNTGLLFPEGEVFGRDDGEAVLVGYESSAKERTKPVHLSIILHERFGIDDRPPEPAEAEEEIDPEDNAARVMKEKIDDLKRQAGGDADRLDEDEASTDEEAEEVEFKQVLHEEWKGVQKKVDVDQLRNLTEGRKNSSEDDTGESQESIAGLKKRVSGFFSKKQA